jgi:hypothetical protein
MTFSVFTESFIADGGKNNDEKSHRIFNFGY